MKYKIPLSYEIEMSIESLLLPDHKSGLLQRTINKFTLHYTNLINAIMFFRYLSMIAESNIDIKMKFINPPSNDTNFLIGESCLWIISIGFGSPHELNEHYKKFGSCIVEVYRFLICNDKVFKSK